MYETSVFEYYAFGYNYHNLRDGCSGFAIHTDDNSINFISEAEEFTEHLKSLDLRVTEIAANKFKNLIVEAKNLPKGTMVDKEFEGKITEAIELLDATLDAELQLKKAFVLTQKRFREEQLLEKIEDLFAENVFHYLPELSQYDFKEAGKCIAFDRPTAAAFHILRGTEGVLRKYYCAIVKRNRIKMLMWFNMTDHLRKRKNPPAKVLLDNLDNIRTNFRNPTQHPEARYDLDEAQDLFSICIDVVNRMVKDALMIDMSLLIFN